MGLSEVNMTVGGEYEEIEKYQDNHQTTEPSRPRTSSYKVADCPVYVPLDIKNL